MKQKLFVRSDVGTGKPMILLHGMFADGSQWETISALLQKHYRVIIVDLLGHGRSPRPPKASYSDKEHIYALRQTLETLNATKEATVVGYSMGGAVALAYSSKYPESVEQLYLISTPFYLTPDQMVPNKYAASILFTKASTSLFSFLEGLMYTGGRLDKLIGFGNNSKAFHKMIGAHDNEMETEIIRKNLNQLVRKFDFVGHLKKLQTPLTFYAGKKDVFIIQSQLDALRRYQPNMDIQRLNIIKIDHMLVQNLPHEIARLVLKNQKNLLHIGLDNGTGEVLLLLNGIEGSSAYWRPILPALQSNRRVIAIDLLGFGKSPKPLNIAYSLDDQVAWIKRTLDSINVTKMTIVGHSLGALTALNYASKFPWQVKELILFSPVFVPKDHVNFQLTKQIKLIDKISDNSFAYSQTAHALGYKRLSQFAPLIRSVKNAVQKQNSRNMLDKTTNIPTIILFGANDPLIDHKYLQQITLAYQNIHVTELASVGHNFPLFNPDLTLQHLNFPNSHKLKKASIMPKTLMQQLAQLSSPILFIKSIFYTTTGLLLLTSLAPWITTILLCLWVFRFGFSTIRGAFSLKNEDLSYMGYIILGVIGMLLSYVLFRWPELALRVSIIILCILVVFIGITRLVVALAWIKRRRLKQHLLLSGTSMTLVGLLALGGSIKSLKLMVISIAIIYILRGIQFAIYTFSASTIAYIRAFSD